MIKTTAELYGVVEQAIKAMHSYELQSNLRCSIGTSLHSVCRMGRG